MLAYLSGHFLIDSAYGNALAVSGGDLYVGGYFGYIGNMPANSIAKWDGTSWSALGSGIDGSVLSLAAWGTNVYAGGDFSMAGGGPANSIARWDGASWSPLSSGMNGAVNALARSGNDLYAGGQFTTAGGKAAAFIARAYLPTLPTLSLVQSGTAITASWPSADTTGFVLEQADALGAPASWVTSSARITADGLTKSVSIPTTSRPQFFRLRSP